MVQYSVQYEHTTPAIRSVKESSRGGISVNVFQASGFLGLACGITLAATLVWYLRLSYWVMTVLVLTSVLIFLVLGVLTEVCTGKPRLIYYRYVIAVMASVAALLLLLRQPLLPYLDITILGIGLFVAGGRIGCLMIGCCHGRPHKWGARYKRESTPPDFPVRLVGVRLFPVQAIESVWVLGVVLMGTAQVVNGQPSGSALSTYIVMYGFGRFGFEFLRGDERRRYFRGVSEAQWTSLLMSAAVVGAGLYGVLPARSWHSWAAAVLVLATLIINVIRAASSIARIELRGPEVRERY